MWFLLGMSTGNSAEQTASIVSFLQEVYESVAETLPDYRDDTWDVETSLVLGNPEDADEYSDLLVKESSFDVSKEITATGKGTKPRKMKRSIKVNPLRRPNPDGPDGGHEEKYLPPGQMKDHYDLYRKKQQGINCASFSTFWRVSQHSFN